jgi:beta-lactamase class A
MAQETALCVSLAYSELGGEGCAQVFPDRPFHAGSTMKVPVMCEVFRQAIEGRFSMDAPLDIRTSFASLLDGSRLELEPESDSDPELYSQVGRSVPIRELVTRMIVRSSNLATNLLVDLVGAQGIQALMEALGIEGIQVLRGVEDGRAFRAGLNNTVTASGLEALFTRIARGEVVSERACSEMGEILAAQEHSEGFPSGLPTGTRVAHKTGWLTSFYHDAGVITRQDGSSFVLVVLTEGIDPVENAHRLAGDLARITYNARAERYML